MNWFSLWKKSPSYNCSSDDQYATSQSLFFWNASRRIKYKFSKAPSRKTENFAANIVLIGKWMLLCPNNKTSPNFCQVKKPALYPIWNLSGHPVSTTMPIINVDRKMHFHSFFLIFQQFVLHVWKIDIFSWTKFWIRVLWLLFFSCLDSKFNFFFFCSWPPIFHVCAGILKNAFRAL